MESLSAQEIINEAKARAEACNGGHAFESGYLQSAVQRLCHERDHWKQLYQQLNESIGADADGEIVRVAE